MPVFPSRLRVLVVDSKSASRLNVVALLTDAEYQVHSARTTKEALRLLRPSASGVAEPPFDIILKEHEPPAGSSACRLLRRMARIELLATIPVVPISTCGEHEEVIKCLAAGAVDYLIKPLRHNELRHIWTRVWWWRRSGLEREHRDPLVQMTATKFHDSSDDKETDCDDDEEPVRKLGNAPANINNSVGNVNARNNGSDGKNGTGNSGNGNSGNVGSNGDTNGASRTGMQPMAARAIDGPGDGNRESGNSDNSATKNGRGGGSGGVGASTTHAELVNTAEGAREAAPGQPQRGGRRDKSGGSNVLQRAAATSGNRVGGGGSCSRNSRHAGLSLRAHAEADAAWRREGQRGGGIDTAAGGGGAAVPTSPALEGHAAMQPLTQRHAHAHQHNPPAGEGAHSARDDVNDRGGGAARDERIAKDAGSEKDNDTSRDDRSDENEGSARGARGAKDGGSARGGGSAKDSGSARGRGKAAAFDCAASGAHLQPSPRGSPCVPPAVTPSEPPGLPAAQPRMEPDALGEDTVPANQQQPHHQLHHPHQQLHLLQLDQQQQQDQHHLHHLHQQQTQHEEQQHGLQTPGSAGVSAQFAPASAASPQAHDAIGAVMDGSAGGNDSAAPRLQSLQGAAMRTGDGDRAGRRPAPLLTAAADGDAWPMADGGTGTAPGTATATGICIGAATGTGTCPGDGAHGSGGGGGSGSNPSGLAHVALVKCRNGGSGDTGGLGGGTWGGSNTGDGIGTLGRLGSGGNGRDAPCRLHQGSNSASRLLIDGEERPAAFQGGRNPSPALVGAAGGGEECSTSRASAMQTPLSAALQRTAATTAAAAAGLAAGPWGGHGIAAMTAGVQLRGGFLSHTPAFLLGAAATALGYTPPGSPPGCLPTLAQQHMQVKATYPGQLGQAGGPDAAPPPPLCQLGNREQSSSTISQGNVSVGSAAAHGPVVPGGPSAALHGMETMCQCELPGSSRPDTAHAEQACELAPNKLARYHAGHASASSAAAVQAHPPAAASVADDAAPQQAELMGREQEQPRSGWPSHLWLQEKMPGEGTPTHAAARPSNAAASSAPHATTQSGRLGDAAETAAPAATCVAAVLGGPRTGGSGVRMADRQYALPATTMTAAHGEPGVDKRKWRTNAGEKHRRKRARGGIVPGRRNFDEEGEYDRNGADDAVSDGGDGVDGSDRRSAGNELSPALLTPTAVAGGAHDTCMPPSASRPPSAEADSPAAAALLPQPGGLPHEALGCCADGALPMTANATARPAHVAAAGLAVADAEADAVNSLRRFGEDAVWPAAIQGLAPFSCTGSRPSVRDSPCCQATLAAAAMAAAMVSAPSLHAPPASAAGRTAPGSWQAGTQGGRADGGKLIISGGGHPPQQGTHVHVATGSNNNDVVAPGVEGCDSGEGRGMVATHAPSAFRGHGHMQGRTRGQKNSSGSGSNSPDEHGGRDRGDSVAGADAGRHSGSGHGSHGDGGSGHASGGDDGRGSRHASAGDNS